MAELYGIKTRVLKGMAETPVSTATCIVFFGGAYSSSSNSNKPIHCDSYTDYLEKFHAGAEPAGHLLLDDAAEYALSRIDGAWFVNCNSESATAEPAAADIKAALDPALAWICLNSSDVPNIVCVPSATDKSLLDELVKQCKGGINNTIHAQAFIDCAQDGKTQVVNGHPVPSAIEVPIADGCVVAAWGDAILDRGPGGVATKSIPASIVLAVARAEQDALNTNNVPYRSVGNLRVAIKGMSVQSVECSCRQDKMNAVVENGIVSFVNKGNNRWYTWGDHTAAVSAGAVDDETYRFDSTVAVLYHILNRFVQKWGTVIDSPMSLRLRDCILSEEQDYLNGLKALGCLVGDPKCEFRPINNTSDTIGKGQFYFTNICTVVPPAKYVELGIAYTDAGLSAFIEE